MAPRVKAIHSQLFSDLCADFFCGSSEKNCCLEKVQVNFQTIMLREKVKSSVTDIWKLGGKFYDCAINAWLMMPGWNQYQHWPIFKVVKFADLE